MKKIFLNRHSIFWKIFIAFWLSNFAVVLAATYFTLHVKHNIDERRLHEEIAKFIGQNVVNRQEEHRPFRPAHKRFRYFPIKIVDATGHVIVDQLSKHKTQDQPKEAIDSFNFIGSDGRRYTIEILKRHRESLLRKYFKRVLIVRLIFILIASGIVSYILSLMITRALTRLGIQARAITQGETSYTMDPSLLQRKDEIGELARDFDDSIHTITALIDSKQTLLHDVSHEMRAPLARLMAAVGLLQQKNHLDKKFLQRIESESDSMNRLIDQILNFSRFENSRVTKSPVNLNMLLEGCAENIRFEFPLRIISINHPASDDEIQLQADASMLEMVFINLFRNGCQHTPDSASISVKLHSDKKKVEIQVEDDGPGLTESDLEKIFTPFFRKQDSGNNFGLGLNIVLRVIEKHKGSITATNTESGGLRFTISLPINGS